jgi:cyclomaltodextrinase / maltogenic alpha-amylase / neopullulanase
MVQPGLVYRHYKGKHYLVLNIAKHSENLETMVVYVALYDNNLSQVWTRPLRMWEELVSLPDGRRVPRFELRPNKESDV